MSDKSTSTGRASPAGDPADPSLQRLLAVWTADGRVAGAVFTGLMEHDAPASFWLRSVPKQLTSTPETVAPAHA